MRWRSPIISRRGSTLDQPINIHLTGCHHSCAQHYVGDIGLLGDKVEQGEDEVEGYHLYVGGGAAATAEQAIGRDYAQSVAFDDLPPLLERLLAAWLAHRRASTESFFEFCRRHEHRPAARPARISCRCGCSRHECDGAHSLVDSRERAVLARAARLAQRLLRRPASASTASPTAAEASLRPRQSDEPDEDQPWHDPALAMDERLELAEDRSPPRRLMAAMAQLDCGQCGYLCQTYAEAYATRRRGRA